MRDIINIMCCVFVVTGCVVSVFAYICLALSTLDWLLERILRSLQIYKLFVQFMYDHFAKKRAKKEGRQ